MTPLQGDEPETEIATADGFDAERYLLANPDVAAWGGEPRFHLTAHGLAEGRRQVTAGWLAAKRTERRAKYERFADALAGEFRFLDQPRQFPVAYGEGQHDLVAYQGESANPSFGAFAEEIAAHPDRRYLDVGCGRRDRLFANCLYLEVYPSVSADLIVTPDAPYPLADASFDGIGCFAVLEHTREPWRVAAELRRMLRPGGLLYIDWPFLQPVHGYPSHYYNATREGLAAMFSDGFETLRLDTLDNQAPDRVLRWFLKGWSEALTDTDARDAFLAKSVGELLAEQPRSPFWKQVLAATPPVTRMTYAAGNTLIARKL